VTLPPTLKIGGRTYAVLYPHVFEDTATVLYGLHDPAGQTIKIARVDEHGCIRHHESVLQTFMHEVIHAVDNIYFGGKLTAWEKGEDAVDQLAEGLIQVLRDNDLDFRAEKI
jgi:hypothetical protein